MAHTNSTPNYNLPQFLGTDKPAWLTDINNAMSDIDAAIAAAKTTADTADAAVGALGVIVGNHTTQLSTLSGAVTSQGNTLNTVTALIGNGVPTTTDQTIIGAINEINAKVPDGYVEVVADGTKTVKQLMEELFALVDFNKVSSKSVLERENTSGTYNVLHVSSLVKTGTKKIAFSVTDASASTVNTTMYTVAATGVKLSATTGANSTSFSDGSSGVDSSGLKYRIIY